jgi:ubiquinone/menaquinone biosynthesis C-methylase UbiE
MSGDRTYVIGTHDSEIDRLGLQHRVWRPSVLEFWRLGGVTEGMTVIDAGAGPGYAAIDLAEIVGPSGRVIALERSRRFLNAMQSMALSRGLTNIDPIEADLVDYKWPDAIADRIWCRWVLAFVSNPAKVVDGMARALKPGGRLLIQEYYDYASWRLAPRSEKFETYVARIIAHWRQSGGDPDVGLAVPRLLCEAGLKIASVRPVVFSASMADFVSRWPMGFAREFLPTMRDAGVLSDAEVGAMNDVLDVYERDADAFTLTPGVLQIEAMKI